MKSPATKETFTTGDIARLCDVSGGTVIKWCERGLLKYYRIPGSSFRRIARKDFVEFLQRNGLGARGQDVLASLNGEEFAA